MKSFWLLSVRFCATATHTRPLRHFAGLSFVLAPGPQSPAGCKGSLTLTALPKPGAPSLVDTPICVHKARWDGHESVLRHRRRMRGRIHQMNQPMQWMLPTCRRVPLLARIGPSDNWKHPVQNKHEQHQKLVSPPNSKATIGKMFNTKIYRATARAQETSIGGWVLNRPQWTNLSRPISKAPKLQVKCIQKPSFPNRCFACV